MQLLLFLLCGEKLLLMRRGEQGGVARILGPSIVVRVGGPPHVAGWSSASTLGAVELALRAAPPSVGVGLGPLLSSVVGSLSSRLLSSVVGPLCSPVGPLCSPVGLLSSTVGRLLCRTVGPISFRL